MKNERLPIMDGYIRLKVSLNFNIENIKLKFCNLHER